MHSNCTIFHKLRISKKVLVLSNLKWILSLWRIESNRNKNKFLKIPRWGVQWLATLRISWTTRIRLFSLHHLGFWVPEHSQKLFLERLGLDLIFRKHLKTNVQYLLLSYSIKCSNLSSLPKEITWILYLHQEWIPKIRSFLLWILLQVFPISSQLTTIWIQ